MGTNRVLKARAEATHDIAHFTSKKSAIQAKQINLRKSFVNICYLSFVLISGKEES